MPAERRGPAPEQQEQVWQENYPREGLRTLERILLTTLLAALGKLLGKCSELSYQS